MKEANVLEGALISGFVKMEASEKSLYVELLCK